MAYGNMFPTSYQPYNYQQPLPMPQPIQPVQQQQAATQGGIIWVQGEAGAKSFLLAPNSTVQLWDSESQTIYLKSTDTSGMPSMKILDYTIRESGSQNASPDAQNAPNFDSFVTKDELHTLEEKIQKRLDKLTQKKVREVEDDE